VRTFLPPGETLDASVRVDMWESFRKPQVRDYIVRMCAGYEGTLRLLAKEYASIQAPILLLWAGHDRHFPPAQAEAVRNVLPSARLEVIPAAEHWMPLSIPETVAAHILDFLRNV